MTFEQAVNSLDDNALEALAILLEGNYVCLGCNSPEKIYIDNLGDFFRSSKRFPQLFSISSPSELNEGLYSD